VPARVDGGGGMSRVNRRPTTLDFDFGFAGTGLPVSG
jgi:hypothetical protein